MIFLSLDEFVQLIIEEESCLDILPLSQWSNSITFFTKKNDGNFYGKCKTCPHMAIDPYFGSNQDWFKTGGDKANYFASTTSNLKIPRNLLWMWWQTNSKRLGLSCSIPINRWQRGVVSSWTKWINWDGSNLGKCQISQRSWNAESQHHFNVLCKIYWDYCIT